MMIQPDNMTSTMRSSETNVSPQSLQIMLDTSEILVQVENFLSGTTYESIYDPDKGVMIPKKKDYGEALANEKGIKDIMFFISSIFNRAIVQSNILDHESHQKLVAEIYENFTDTIFLNLKTWQMEEEKADMVVYTIMHMIELFLTRPIGNEERGTSRQNIRQDTVRNLPQKRGLFRRDEEYT